MHGKSEICKMDILKLGNNKQEVTHMMYKIALKI